MREDIGKNILNLKRKENLVNKTLFIKGNTLVSHTRSSWVYSLNAKTCVSEYENFSLSSLRCVDYNELEFVNSKLKVSFMYKSFIQNFYFSEKDFKRKYNFEVNFLQKDNLPYQEGNKAAHYLKNRPYNFFFKKAIGIKQQEVVLKKNKDYCNFSNGREQLMNFFRNKKISQRRIISNWGYKKELASKRIDGLFILRKRKNRVSTNIKRAIKRVRLAIFHRIAKKSPAFFWKLDDLKRKCFFKGVIMCIRRRKKKKWVKKRGLFYKKRRKGFRKMFYLKAKKTIKNFGLNKISNIKSLKGPVKILNKYRRRYFKNKVIGFAAKKVTSNRL